MNIHQYEYNLNYFYNYNRISLKNIRSTLVFYFYFLVLYAQRTVLTELTKRIRREVCFYVVKNR